MLHVIISKVSDKGQLYNINQKINVFILLIVVVVLYSFQIVVNSFCIDNRWLLRRTRLHCNTKSFIMMSHKTVIDTEEREDENSNTESSLQLEQQRPNIYQQLNQQQEQLQQQPIWDPIQQIYIGGIVPQQQCVYEMIQANHGILRIFGYGSLCWNPGIIGQSALADQRVTCTLGIVKGYRRVWAQKSTDHRGTPQFPGIVCTLLTDHEYYQQYLSNSIIESNSKNHNQQQQQPSMTEGLIYEVPIELVEECLQELDFREKGGYARDVITITINNQTGGNEEQEVQALLYRGTPDNPAFWRRAMKDLPFTAAIIASAIGPSGENHVYLNQLNQFLIESTTLRNENNKDHISLNDDDTLVLSKMTNILRSETNLYFLLGCGSNQHNQLLLHSKDNVTNLINTDETHIMKEIVICTKKTIIEEQDYITNIYTGGGNSGCLTKHGYLYLFGWNSNGQLGSSGIDSNCTTTIPLPIVKALNDIKVDKVSLGFSHTLLIERDTGILYAFGNNKRGQVDINTEKTEYMDTPIIPSFLRNDFMIDISAGVFHSAAMTKDGELITYGCSRFGQSLSSIQSNGSNDENSNDNNNKNNITFGRWIPPDGSKLTKVSCGRHHTAVIDDRGRIWTFGDNKYGQLGRDISGMKYDREPGLVALPENIYCYDLHSGWSHIVVMAKASTDDHVTTKKVFGWGRNDKGQLGTGELVDLNTVTKPIELFASTSSLYDNITMISCGSESTVIVQNNELIYSCGWNEHGNLGTGDTIDSRSLKPVIHPPITIPPLSSLSSCPKQQQKQHIRLLIAAGGSHLLAMKIVESI